MGGDSDQEAVTEIASDVAALNDTEKTKKKKGWLWLWRIWKGMFRLHGDDFEARLKYISKEEAVIISRMSKRSHRWRRLTRNLIVFSVILEVIAVVYAIMTTRSLDLDWKMRALRVLPMFLLPGLSSIIYSALGSFTRMRDRKDKNTLERLRAERQAKIDELKERTNYYTTQQLIQRYDSDPAAKAAAATVLASKLGAESGLKVYLGDESEVNFPTGRSNDVEFAKSNGIRKRKHLHARGSSVDSSLTSLSELDMMGVESPENSQHHPMVVDHYQPTDYSTTQDGSWISKLAALLVGEDPSQSYALICGNCHMHNGLAKKEDFPFITYYCPHCKSLNQPKHHQEVRERVSGPTSSHMNSSITADGASAIQNNSSSMVDKVLLTSSPLADSAGSTEIDKVSTAGSPVADSAGITEIDEVLSEPEPPPGS